jgi:predicted nucleotidyltransferase component of viral defense system
MITDTEIEQKAAEFDLPPQQVEKDYVHGWVLWAINSRPALKRQLVLKGGNALRKGYFDQTRFSKDLDFSCLDHIDPDFLHTELREVCGMVQEQTGITFNPDSTRVRDKNLPFKADALEARIYFRGFYNEENLTLKTQVDVTQFDRLYLPAQERSILHPYSDARSCSGTITCQKAEEILASKLSMLLQRRRAGDLFDLLYTLLVHGGDAINRRELIATFLKKSIFEPRPDDGRSALLSIPIASFQSTWAALLVPAASLLTFDFASDNFTALINGLFALVAPSPARRGGGGGGGGYVPIVDFTYCRGDARSAIMEAARNRVMIEMTYDGRTRFVEPYRLEYYVRKIDGVGNEYFWGWDTTGGRTSGPGIKMFFADKLRNVRVTNRSYAPRYPVEI